MFVFCNSEGKIWQKKCKGKIAEDLVNHAMEGSLSPAQSPESYTWS